MNSAAYVDTLIKNWAGKEKRDVVCLIADACMGWPYVYGAAGAECTPSTRRSYAKNYQTRKPDESAVILSKCQVCRPKDPKGSCSGCKWYPTAPTRCFDCRGFTRWVFGKVGVTIKGAGCTSQYNDDSNWTEKGEISKMPETVCCVFMYSKKNNNYGHTGIYVGNGRIIHCSGEVKVGKTTDNGWTHYAVPKNLDGVMPVSHKTIRKGDTGPEVVECQTDLIKLGYDLSPYGADGKFGKKTQQAVMDFQKSVGLKADGVVGPATWEALDNAVGPEPGPEPEPTKLYTVHIPHQNADQCEKLKVLYPDCWITEE